MPTKGISTASRNSSASKTKFVLPHEEPLVVTPITPSENSSPTKFDENGPICDQLLRQIADGFPPDDIMRIAIEKFEIPISLLVKGNKLYQPSLKCLKIWQDNNKDSTLGSLKSHITEAIRSNVLDAKVLELFDNFTVKELEGIVSFHLM